MSHPAHASASRSVADLLGLWASGLCVVHCLLTPVLLSFSAVFAHLLPGEEVTHRVLVMPVAFCGAVALFISFRQHRCFIVLMLMLCGLLCIGGAAWFGDRLPSHAYEVGITVVGSALMMVAHRLNHTFCRQCECGAGCRAALSKNID